jgi:signal transduction histidine kinase/CheY-like chemotaxis protein
MPISIRSRLLLLVMSVLLPAMAGALWVIAEAFQAERAALERGLRDTAGALSMVVDRELTQRAAIARTLSMSIALDKAPSIEPPDLATFDRQAQHAMQGLSGWVELRSADRLLLSTRPAAENGPPAAPASAGSTALGDRPAVGSLERGEGRGWRAAVVQPVQRRGQTVAELAVTLVPDELQHIIDEQHLPDGWVATVMDNRGTVVARHPDAARFVGRPAPTAMREQLAAARGGLYHGEALDGQPVVGYYSTSPQGWTFATAMPEGEFSGRVPAAVFKLVAGGAILLALAAGGALWISRRIAEPVDQLEQMAASMQAREPVGPLNSGLAELDQVGAAMAAAARAMRDSHSELERQVEEAIARTREAEQRASMNQRVEALGRLTGGVAHDVNNLLGVISNSAYLIERRTEQLPELQAPLAATMRAVEAGRRLTQHLLRFAGRHATRPERVDLALALPEMRELLQIVLGKRIAIEVQVAPGTPPIVVDAGELELALINLALNARDALQKPGPEGGHVWLEASNSVEDDIPDLAPGRFVAITFTDDGHGIDEAVASRVFEPFFTTKPSGRGSGLGLSQVHGFCAEAGGLARIASTPGLGTTVTLLLPAEGAVAAPPPPRERAVPTAGADLAGLRVLVVEDNEALGDVTGALLRSYGSVVQLARSGEQALGLVDTEPPFDAVLSDIVMPGGMDGIALAQTLRQRFPRLAIVLITGYSQTRVPVEQFPLLHKPCNPGDLVTALREAVSAQH